MYEKQVEQIYNILSVNCQRLPILGLVRGNLGVVLFFYHYDKSVGKKSKITDAILTNMLQLYPKAYRKNPLKILELGWGIKYLIKNGFVTNSSNVLDVFDALASTDYSYAQMEKEFMSSFPIFSVGLYSCILPSRRLMEEALLNINKILINNIEKNIPLCYIISVYFFVRKCKDLIGNSELTVQLERLLLMRLQEYINSFRISLPENYILWQLLSDEHRKCLPNCTCDIIDGIYANWQSIMYEDYIKVSECPPVENVDAFISDINMSVPLNKLALDGLAALGINLIKRNKYLP